MRKVGCGNFFSEFKKCGDDIYLYIIVIKKGL